ncbi:hypothetical protein LguiB_029445 [Lonicera macranthoides]
MMLLKVVGKSQFPELMVSSSCFGSTGDRRPVTCMIMDGAGEVPLKGGPMSWDANILDWLKTCVTSFIIMQLLTTKKWKRISLQQEDDARNLSRQIIRGWASPLNNARILAFGDLMCAASAAWAIAQGPNYISKDLLAVAYTVELLTEKVSVIPAAFPRKMLKFLMAHEGPCETPQSWDGGGGKFETTGCLKNFILRRISSCSAVADAGGPGGPGSPEIF